MNHPDFLGQLHGIDHAERIAPVRQRNLEHADQAVHGLGDVGLAASAAMVQAARQIDLAPSGNARNSFSAAPIQEMGRVFRVIGCPPLAVLHSFMLSYLTTPVKGAPPSYFPYPGGTSSVSVRHDTDLGGQIPAQLAVNLHPGRLAVAVGPQLQVARVTR